MRRPESNVRNPPKKRAQTPSLKDRLVRRACYPVSKIGDRACCRGVSTPNVHASDRFDTTAGDIEELLNGDLVRAYEVTVRTDWKNRVGDFRKKMDGANLAKYTIIASNVNRDDDLAEPADMIRFLAPYGRDMAVVDIFDFVNVFAMKLNSDELRRAVTQT